MAAAKHSHQWVPGAYHPILASLRLLCVCGATKQVVKGATIWEGPEGQVSRKSSPADVRLWEAAQAQAATLPALLAPAAQAAPEPEPEPEAEPEPEPEPETRKAARTPAAQGEQVINLLATENPKRVGSASFDRFALYQDGMTVAEYLEAGGWRSDLRWDSKRGFIALG